MLIFIIVCLFIPIHLCFIMFLIVEQLPCTVISCGMNKVLSIHLTSSNPLVLFGVRVRGGRPLTLLSRIMFWDLSEVSSCHSATQCFSRHTLRACRERREMDRTEASVLHHTPLSKTPSLAVSVLTFHSRRTVVKGPHTQLQTQPHTHTHTLHHRC